MQPTRAAAPAAVAAPPPAPVVVVMEVPAPAAAPKRKVSFGAEVSPAKAVAGLQGDDGGARRLLRGGGEESVYSEEELSWLEEAEDELWAQGGRGRCGGCVPVCCRKSKHERKTKRRPFCRCKLHQRAGRRV